MQEQQEQHVAAPRFSRFDSDPEAIAWAREKIKWAVRAAELHEKHANDARDLKSGARWHIVAGFMRRMLLGGTGCAIAAFDERLPEWVGHIEASEPVECTHPREDVIVRVSGGPRIEYCKRCKTVVQP